MSNSTSLLCSYIECRTVHPTPDYTPAISLLSKQASLYGLDTHLIELVHNNPFLLVSLHGSDPSLPSIVFYSHMDVVPVESSEWMFDPFIATLVDGKLYGRGTQDMKSIGIMHLEALGRLKQRGFQPKRTFHVLFGPDEEVGGTKGVKLLVESSHFTTINPILWVDEGLASGHDDATIPIFYGERAPFWMTIAAQGKKCHGASSPSYNAPLEVLRLANLFVSEIPVLFNGSSCNVTLMESLVSREQLNIIPDRAMIGFDIRLSPYADVEDFKRFVHDHATRADVSLEFLRDADPGQVSTLDSEFFKCISQTVADFGHQWKEQIFPASTDARFVRNKGVLAYGFSWLPNHEQLLHQKNEYICVSTFHEGISVFEALMVKLSEL
ncbi:hypothetical protein GEMRC1_003656 [Eukaryota sp. GEM-RC1]